MKGSLTIACYSKIGLALVLLLLVPSVYAQTEQTSTANGQSSMVNHQSSMETDTLTIDTAALFSTTKTILDKKFLRRNLSEFKPDPIRATWLALVIPGAGQFYNRKYWKLPIIYGGFMGCLYALSWNNMMYKDYSQAYLDIMDNDPGTASYNKFLHLGVKITAANEERYKQLFKSRKDKYRRWRDLSIFVMIGVYALSVIDAYVDAELSEFDISKDLSLKVSPAVIPNHSGGNPLQAQSFGVNCSLNF